MFKRLLNFVIISTVSMFTVHAQWVSLDNNKPSGSSPEVTIISDDNSGTVLRIDLAGFYIKEFNFGDKTYQSIDLNSDVFTLQAGFPEIPYVAEILAIPDMASVTIDIVETGNMQTFSNINIQPARESWFEGAEEPAYVEDSKAYLSETLYPAKLAGVERPSVLRDFRISRVSVFPVRYNAGTKELQVVSSITIRVNYGSGVVINPKTSQHRNISPTYAQIYKGFIANYNQVLARNYGGVENGRDVMLCIMPDEFVASFQVYADWKRQSGIDIHVTKFSDIGASANNPETIKDHITDAYFNWEYPPTYVLIIGDNGIFPKKIITYPDYSFANEDFFVEVDGEDYLPDMMIGRFTNQGDYRMQVIIEKNLNYEKNPDVSNSAWFKKGICCSNNQYESQVETKRFAAQTMLDYGNFTSVDTMMSDGSWGGAGCTYTIADVKNAVNEGRSYLNYRGEGWSSGWNANCASMHTSDVTTLNNGTKLTFVTSIGCGVAMFDAGGGNCFGEEWLQLGELGTPKGAVCFVGPVSNTHTTYNNKIDKGIYIGMFMEGMDTPGQALLSGRLYMYSVFGDTFWVEYQTRVYCVLGDPSVHIWKDVPENVFVSHPTTIPVGFSQQQIMVDFASSGLPVDSAQVCLTGDDIFVTGYTDASGHLYLPITPLIPDTLTITVRGKKVIPYQGTIIVIQTDEHVAPDGNHIAVDIDGNTNGSINPNENINISFALKNWGILSAMNVLATISSTDTYVTIVSTGAVSYGDIAPNASVMGDPFQIFVNPNCPVGHVLTVDLHVSSINNTWDYFSNDSVKGCNIVYTNYLVFDTLATPMNFRMDPGETVRLYLTVANIGDDLANSVNGVLSCNDPYITIVDPNGSFGTINSGASKVSAEDYFEVSVDPSCPGEYMVEYSLFLYTQGNLYPYENVITFSIPVSMLMESDFTGPDNYGYYAYSSLDTQFDQAPEYDWFEINQLGTLMYPTSSEYTETIDLPFNFKYYGIEYQQIRVSTDGWVAFGSGVQTMYENQTMPSNNSINCMVAAFWDDLYAQSNESGMIYYYNDTTNHRFIIEYDGMGHWGDEDSKEFFQIILLDTINHMTPTGDGEIIIVYKDVIDISSSTVGIENHDQDDGIEYVFNSIYDVTANPIRDEVAIKFTTEPPFVHVEIVQAINDGLVMPGFLLDQNYPNPFESFTWISYSISDNAYVDLNIYNLNGQLVKSLVKGNKTPGKYTLRWDGSDNSGNIVSPGMYFYRLQTNGFDKAMKMFKL